MGRVCCGVAAAAALCAIAGAASHAEIIQLAPVADATLYQDPAGGLASGAGAAMFAGTNSALAVRRALIRFDIAGALPAGAIVTGVTLRLHNSGNTTSHVVGLHRVLESWTEGPTAPAGAGGSGAASGPGDVTWIHRTYPGTAWSLAGGVFEAGPGGALTVGGIGHWTWESSPALVADVQSWMDAPGGNFGWAIIGAEGAASTAKRFGTREETDPNLRPMLTVTYVPAPGATALLAIGAAASRRRRRES